MGSANSCCASKDSDKFDATDAAKIATGAEDHNTAEVVVSEPAPPSPTVNPVYTKETAAPPKSSNEFKITVDKTQGTRLGVDVDHQDGQTLLIDAITGGLVEKWNTENPGQAVKQGDRIVEVNGIRGDVLQLVDECKKNKVLEMMVRRC